MIKLSLKDEFEASAEEVDAIFVNFRTLHEVYRESFHSLQDQLSDLPNAYTTKIEHAKKLFDNMANTVTAKQKSISSQLYSQAVVLLMGNAESILESAFGMLVVNNFRKIKLPDSKNTNFSLQEVLEAKNDTELGRLLLSKLEANKNPSEKLSFQNMKQLEKILSDNFSIKISPDYIVKLHEFWQIRHVIIHKQGYVDQQFLDNLAAAGIRTKKYQLYQPLKLTREEYENCFGLLVLMFDEIDKEIDRLKLDYSFPF